MNKRNLILGIALIVVSLAAYALFGRTPVLPVEASSIVELKDGDSIDLAMDEVKKEINGVEYTMLAYNGSIPGPSFTIPQGAEITINFTNNSGIPTMLHSHGVRMDNASDGSQSTQDEIPPGGTFTYTLKFPDAGAYWYHPHVRDDYAQELGAYGQFLVTPREEGYWNPVNREVALFLDDILIENGEIAADPKQAKRTLMGTFGTVMLVNGDTKYTLAAQKGEVIRFYLTNAANTRPFNFRVEGAKLKLVGGDSGAYERDSWQNAVLISPSERAVVEVLFEKGGSFALQNATPEKTYTLGTVDVSDSPIAGSYASAFSELREHMDTVRSIDPFRQYFGTAPDKRLSLSVEMHMDMGGMGSMGGHGTHQMPDGSMMGNMGMMGGVPDGGIEWEDDAMMNAMSTKDSVHWILKDEETGKENMDIQWSFERDKPVKIRIENTAESMHPMQHPVHFHGQRFLVVARDGVPQENLAWKDTVLVKAGETVDILLDPSNPGKWMAHCHILEHIESGMMLEYVVE